MKRRPGAVILTLLVLTLLCFVYVQSKPLLHTANLTRKIPDTHHKQMLDKLGDEDIKEFDNSKDRIFQFNNGNKEHEISRGQITTLKPQLDNIMLKFNKINTNLTVPRDTKEENIISDKKKIKLTLDKSPQIKATKESSLHMLHKNK